MIKKSVYKQFFLDAEQFFECSYAFITKTSKLLYLEKTSHNLFQITYQITSSWNKNQLHYK